MGSARLFRSHSCHAQVTAVNDFLLTGRKGGKEGSRRAEGRRGAEGRWEGQRRAPESRRNGSHWVFERKEAAFQRKGRGCQREWELGGATLPLPF